MGLKALITGGTGFIGSNLIKELIERDCEVYALIRKNSTLGYKRLKNLKFVKYVYAEDIFNYDSKVPIEIMTENITIKSLLPQFDICFHLASYGVDYRQQDIHNIIEGNINFTMSLLEFCKVNQTKKVINTGSCFEYGINELKKLNEDSILNPQTYYAISKVTSENMAKIFCKNNNIKLITVRPFGVYGENEGLHRFVPQLMKAIIKNEDMKMTLGEQIRDYLYIEDLTNAYIILALSDVPLYEAYNICSGNDIKIKDIAIITSKIADINLKIFHFGEIPYRQNEVMYFVGDNTKIKTYTDWQPKYTLEQGLKRTYEWYKTNLEELM